MDIDSDDDSFPDDVSVSSEEELFITNLQSVRKNVPLTTYLGGNGYFDYIQNITNERWEKIGRDISNNTHLEELYLDDHSLDDEKASFLFRGLTGSSSMKDLSLNFNDLSVVTVRSMVPFLQHADNLKSLDLSSCSIQSEGFNFLCRALRASPIESLVCGNCEIESIEINIDYFPRQLKELYLHDNCINAEGCREIAQLLQGGDSILTELHLDDNLIDDEGVAILVDALKHNTSLRELSLRENDGITKEGLVMLLKLVNDISSIEATLQSKHKLKHTGLWDIITRPDTPERSDIQRQIRLATKINREFESNPEAAGREKMIVTQLHSVKRAELAELQGVSQSVYGEINPLHLPEVLSLVGRRHGQGELYVALKSSIAGVISTVDRKQCIKEKMAELHAQLQELEAKLAAIEGNEGGVGDGHRLHRNKRLRK